LSIVELCEYEGNPSSASNDKGQKLVTVSANQIPTVSGKVGQMSYYAKEF